jgi:hypothetical protein
MFRLALLVVLKSHPTAFQMSVFKFHFFRNEMFPIRSPFICTMLSCCALLLGLAACSTSASRAQSAARATLDSARVAYDNGDYERTLYLLGHSHDIDSAPPDMQVEAHKLEAFSYCVTNRITLCRAQFAKILDIAPNFELSPAEKGHPIWGPAFEAARRKHAAPS